MVPKTIHQDDSAVAALLAKRAKWRAAKRRWASTHKDEIAAKDARYRAANRDRLRAKKAADYAANRERVKARSAKYQAANKDAKFAYDKARRKANAGRLKAHNAAWHRANPDKSAAIRHRRRAIQSAAAGTFTAADISDIRKMQRDKCAGCQCGLKDKGHIDHIIALTKGGSNNRRNLQLLCRSCNSSKNAGDPIEWMRSRGFLL